MQFRWADAPRVIVEAWGDGGDWLLQAAPRWLGCHDDPSSFDPSINARLDRLWRQHGPFRLGGTGVVWQELLYSILGQRVSTTEAVRSWRRLVHAWGTPAPGPCGLMLPPTPEAVASRSYIELHRFDVERSRATAVIAAARSAGRLERAASMPVSDALVHLMQVPGIGPWTATSTLTVMIGDPDTVIEGDYGIPTSVCWAFTGDATRQTSDSKMLALLEPYRPHRQRVIRLLLSAGLGPPRRAPRMAPTRISRL